VCGRLKHPPRPHGDPFVRFYIASKRLKVSICGNTRPAKEPGSYFRSVRALDFQMPRSCSIERISGTDCRIRQQLLVRLSATPLSGPVRV